VLNIDVLNMQKLVWQISKGRACSKSDL